MVETSLVIFYRCTCVGKDFIVCQFHIIILKPFKNYFLDNLELLKSLLNLKLGVDGKLNFFG